MIGTATMLVLCFIAGQALAVPPATTTGKVVSVHDGDTVTVRTDDGQTLKVRLQGIDTPELKQAFGSRSRDDLSALVKGKPVTLVEHGRDKYGRTLANVLVDGVDANARQVATGMAWHYSRFDKSPALARAQEADRAARTGLWGDAAPVAPWGGGRARRTARRPGRPWAQGGRVDIKRSQKPAQNPMPTVRERLGSFRKIRIAPPYRGVPPPATLGGSLAISRGSARRSDHRHGSFIAAGAKVALRPLRPAHSVSFGRRCSGPSPAGERRPRPGTPPVC